jgi:hypothetical protein
LEVLGLRGEREAMLDVSSRAGVEALGLGARGAMTRDEPSEDACDENVRSEKVDYGEI